jgi:hypothetical protein
MPSLKAGYAGPVAGMDGMIKLWSSIGNPGYVLAVAGGKDGLTPVAPHTIVPPSFPARFENSDGGVAWLRAHMADYNLVVIHTIWGLVNIRVAQVLRRDGLRYCMVRWIPSTCGSDCA